MLTNLPIPSNLQYNLPPSMSLNPNLLNNNNMFSGMGNFKSPMFPNSKGQGPSQLLNQNLLNYTNLMGSGQYSLPGGFDMGQGGPGGQQGGGGKGNPMSKKEADDRSI